MKNRLLLPLLLIPALLLLSSGCSDPLSVDTPRRVIPVNMDSILLSDPFLNKPSDTLYAQVDGRPISFDSELLRPIFYNRQIDGQWYLSVRGSRYDLKGEQYESLSLRLDAVKDTGTYPMMGSYSIPKQVNPNLPSQYVGKYEERNAGSKLSIATAPTEISGSIRVVKVDTLRRIVVGTFTLTGYDAAAEKDVRIENGIFRLRLDI